MLQDTTKPICTAPLHGIGSGLDTLWYLASLNGSDIDIRLQHVAMKLTVEIAWPYFVQRLLFKNCVNVRVMEFGSRSDEAVAEFETSPKMSISA